MCGCAEALREACRVLQNLGRNLCKRAWQGQKLKGMGMSRGRGDGRSLRRNLLVLDAGAWADRRW